MPYFGSTQFPEELAYAAKSQHLQGFETRPLE